MNDTAKIYILGASCSGVSTLGGLLARRFGTKLIDIDDYYWVPTDPPYTTKRAPIERVRLISAQQSQTDGWVMAGSFTDWGDALLGDVDLIVFVYTPAPIRMQRLKQREHKRYGARILPNGDMHQIHIEFSAWAERYDDPAFDGRSLARHEAWLKGQSIPVLRLLGTDTPKALVRQVEEDLLKRLRV